MHTYFNPALTPKDIATPVPASLEPAAAFVWVHNKQALTPSKSHRVGGKEGGNRGGLSWIWLRFKAGRYDIRSTPRPQQNPAPSFQ